MSRGVWGREAGENADVGTRALGQGVGSQTGRWRADVVDNIICRSRSRCWLAWTVSHTRRLGALNPFSSQRNNTGAVALKDVNQQRRSGAEVLVLCMKLALGDNMHEPEQRGGVIGGS